MCIKSVMKIKCKNCGGNAVKNGTVKSTGKQRYFCKVCKRSFLEKYQRKSFKQDVDKRLIILIKEGCGIRSAARILKIAPQTVISRIKQIATNILKPPIIKGQNHEMDEMITFIGNKKNRICIAYAIERRTKSIIDFRVGRRNKQTLRKVVNTLLLSESQEIRTDKLNLYLGIIPKKIHKVKNRGINYIERNNLTLRTHLKRLNRRTICYSKSLTMLIACLKIYFWG